MNLPYQRRRETQPLETLHPQRGVLFSVGSETGETEAEGDDEDGVCDHGDEVPKAEGAPRDE